MCKRKTTAEYAAQVAALGKGITVVGEYAGARKKAAHSCSKGHQWDARPSDILAGRSCPYCAGTKHDTSYQQRLDAMGDGVIAIGEYENAQTKITHQCTEGHQWDATPAGISGCPHCSGRIPDKPYQDRLDDMGNGITALGEYRNNSTKITHECSHGHQWDAQPCSLLHGTGCPECAGYGFSTGKPSQLYVLEHKLPDGRTRTNIGITNRTVEERYDADALATITRRTTIKGLGADVRKLEIRLHEMLGDHLDAKGFGFRTKKGTKECFDYPFEAAARLAHCEGSPDNREVARAEFN